MRDFDAAIDFFTRVLGMALGIAYAYYVFLASQVGVPQASESPFVIPWFDLFAVGAIAYAAGLLATIPPARKAARLPPAEALRIVE